MTHGYTLNIPMRNITCVHICVDYMYPYRSTGMHQKTNHFTLGFIYICIIFCSLFVSFIQPICECCAFCKLIFVVLFVKYVQCLLLKYLCIYYIYNTLHMAGLDVGCIFLFGIE